MNFPFREKLSRYSYLLIFFVFVIISFFAYRNCFDIDIPTDSYLLMLSFQKLGSGGILNNFHDIGMAPVSNTIIFILYKIIGTNSCWWILVSVIFHALNSFFIFLLGSSLFRQFGIKKNLLLGFIAAVLFLISPYQTEVLLWNPRMLNYTLATGFYILSFYFLTNYFFSGKRNHNFLFHIFFLLAIFSFESPLFFPLAIGFIYIFYRFAFAGIISTKKFFVAVFFPQWLMIAGYFLACRFWLGAWIVHYGASTHLLFSIPLFVTNYVKYFAKFFLFYRYLPSGRGNLLHSMHININNSVVAIILFIIALALLSSAVYYFFKKKRTEMFLCAMLFFTFCISLLPVINLDTTFVGGIISDRYGYLPSVAFYLLLVALVHLLFEKLEKIVFASLIILCFVLLSSTFPAWNDANKLTQGLVKNFEPYLNTNKKIYVLNLPDNKNWVLSFRGGFEEYYALKFQKNFNGNFNIIASFFETGNNDSVMVERKSENEFMVRSFDNGKRFLYSGLWAKSYSNDEYEVKFNEECSAYRLHFFSPPANSLLVYCAGDKWRAVSF